MERMAIFVLLDNTNKQQKRERLYEYYEYDVVYGDYLLSTVIIGGFFIHRDNKRNAAANKRTVFKGRLNDILHYKNYIWVEVS